MHAVETEFVGNDLSPCLLLSEADVARRNELVLSYRPYVIRVAHAVVLTVPAYVELDDLIGWGYLGLIEAADRFEESRGVPFRSYAHFRIKGAIYDGLRREFGAHVPSQLASEDFGADPAGPDVLCADAAYARGAADELFGLAAELSPDHLVWIAELRALVDEAMESLLPIESEVLRQRSFLDKPVVALAGARNLSKSWLSRVHTRALVKLREEFENRIQARGVQS